MLRKTQIIEGLLKLKPALQREFGLTEIALFGSIAREDQKSGSDIDLLIDLSKNTSSDFFNIAFQLQDFFYPVKVDIVPKKGIKATNFKDLIYV
jgi:uncharacterized protein